MFFVVDVGIGENTDIIVSPISVAVSVIAITAWLFILMILLTISLGSIIVGKLSTMELTVFCITGFKIGCTGANILFKIRSLIILFAISLGF